MPKHPPVRGAVITGWGTALPPKTLTNRDLEEMGLDTSDEWIVERTGIRERHVGGTTAGLSAEAGRLALGMSGLEPDSIDAIVLATRRRIARSQPPRRPSLPSSGCGAGRSTSTPPVRASRTPWSRPTG